MISIDQCDIYVIFLRWTQVLTARSTHERNSYLCELWRFFFCLYLLRFVAKSLRIISHMTWNISCITTKQSVDLPASEHVIVWHNVNELTYTNECMYATMLAQFWRWSRIFEVSVPYTPDQLNIMARSVRLEWNQKEKKNET